MHSVAMSYSSRISHLLPSLNKSHLTHSDIAPLIVALKDVPLVSVQLIGHSFEQRPIHLLSIGQGPTVIFAWTQMHGNEATATAAVFDLVDQLIGHKYESLKEWESVFTIHILPMLNPDGAQRCIRQNAQSIDINRDARELQSPEGQLLMELVEKLAPDIGFNLHDQSPYYRCGKSSNPATMAFLAPSFDIDKTINKSRERAMTLIVHMNEALQIHIPNCVARYDDSYCASAFGDNIAAQDISTILIESGAARGDDNRQVARTMNVLAIMSALEYLMTSATPDAASTNDEKETTLKDRKNEKNISTNISAYFAIPQNVPEALSSLLIRNVNFMGGHSYTAGISVKQSARYSNKFLIDFTGDLNNQAGLVDFDAQGVSYKQGKVFSPKDPMTLTNRNYIALLRKGYLYMNDPQQLITNKSDYDICYAQEPLHGVNAFVLQQPAYSLFIDLINAHRLSFAMLNGELVDINA
jgi:hypothetical protein